jgi:crossover junction endodeoxyribonuclease RusA
MRDGNGNQRRLKESVPLIDITLPWPAEMLFPNHHAPPIAKHGAVKAARLEACLLTSSAIVGVADVAAWTLALERVAQARKGEIRIMLCAGFAPPDRRHRDIDNCLAACKAYIDGLAEALYLNDSCFSPYFLDWLPVVERGAVRLRLFDTRHGLDVISFARR